MYTYAQLTYIHTYITIRDRHETISRVDVRRVSSPMSLREIDPPIAPPVAPPEIRYPSPAGVVLRNRRVTRYGVPYT